MKILIVVQNTMLKHVPSVWKVSGKLDVIALQSLLSKQMTYKSQTKHIVYVDIEWALDWI